MNLKTILCFGVLTLGFVASVIAQATLPEPVPPAGDAKANLVTAMYGTIINNPASLFAIIVLCALAWLMDELPFINSKYVTHYTAIIGASSYWLFCFPSSVPKHFPHPIAVLVCIGFLCGVVAGLLHKRVMSYAIDYLRSKIPTKENKDNNEN